MLTRSLESRTDPTVLPINYDPYLEVLVANRLKAAKSMDTFW
jgi:hypothetical protein